jgi:hypothetical protein
MLQVLLLQAQGFCLWKTQRSSLLRGPFRSLCRLWPHLLLLGAAGAQYNKLRDAQPPLLLLPVLSPLLPTSPRVTD